MDAAEDAFLVGIDVWILQSFQLTLLLFCLLASFVLFIFSLFPVLFSSALQVSLMLLLLLPLLLQQQPMLLQPLLLLYFIELLNSG